MKEHLDKQTLLDFVQYAKEQCPHEPHKVVICTFRWRKIAGNQYNRNKHYVLLRSLYILSFKIH